MTAPSDISRTGRHVPGRRLGRPLRAGQRQTIADVLPNVQLQLPQVGPLPNPCGLFDQTVSQVWLEIGFGKGEHLAWQLTHNPDVGIIGCEPFMTGVAGLLRSLTPDQLGRLKLYPGDGLDVLETLPDASLNRVFLLFPDPWPKARHWKRRFVQPERLDQVARVLRAGGLFWLATDHPGYRRWMLAHLQNRQDFRWLADKPGDWQRPEGMPPTRYEEKARRQGRSSTWLRYERLPGDGEKA